MLRLSVAIALSLISITACGREPSTSAAPPAAAPAAPAAQQSAPAPAAPAAADPALTAESAASQESADTESTAADSRDVALERLAAMPADQQLPAGKWQVGKNYTPLVPAQPTNVAPGKIEVVEVFWYGCPHCNHLEPFIQSWMKNKPEYIEFVRVPVMWGPVHRAHARLFYIVRAVNRADLDVKVFETIHKDGNMLVANDEA